LGCRCCLYLFGGVLCKPFFLYESRGSCQKCFYGAKIGNTKETVAKLIFYHRGIEDTEVHGGCSATEYLSTLSMLYEYKKIEYTINQSAFRLITILQIIENAINFCYTFGKDNIISQ